MISFEREELKVKVAALASQNVLIGTSSWKYPGWCGQLYDERRYVTRSKFSKKRFEETCLTEYAEVFKTVCVDAGYYKFPDEKYLVKLVAQVPDDFRFSFKVTDEITIKNFPNQPRHGTRAGKPNLNFLNPDLFTRAFLKPCESVKDNVGVLMFEFSQFHQRDFEHGRDFVAALDTFLSKLPTGWQYGVEIRNQHFLEPEYFQMLASNEVTHVFNSWTRMPPVSEQMAIPESVTTDFLAARFLLTPGTGYENAVKSFSPYTETKLVDENARAAGKALIEKAKRISKLPSYVFINNRLEGNAMKTIEAMLSMEPAPASAKVTSVEVTAVKYPSYWFARLAALDIESRYPLMIFDAIYEVTEETARAAYRKEAALFDLGTDEEVQQHCIAIVTQAAQEYAEARYGLNRAVASYDYVLWQPEPRTAMGLEFEEAIYTSTNGVKIWFQGEEHPEQ